MSTTSIVLAIRAIAIEFTRRIYMPVLIVFFVVAALFVILIWWLVMMSVWWWLLAVPFIGLLLVGAILLTIIGIVFRFLRRTSTKNQRKIVSEFVDSLQEVSEVIQTPKIYILYRLVKDIVRPGDEAYVKTIANNTKALGPRFRTIVASFDQPV